jgi:Flp pilus assembly pilin Flp
MQIVFGLVITFISLVVVGGATKTEGEDNLTS